MSTRFTKGFDGISLKGETSSIPMGYEGSNIPDDMHLPSCTIEDVDRALFNLFNEELPLFYKLEKESRRIPVIFATGERFAILRRKRPLRDNSGALILPLISILRTGVQQESTKGSSPGEDFPLVIKKRLSEGDIDYQRLVNKLNLQNADDAASAGNLEGRNLNTVSSSDYYAARPGALATRNPQNKASLETQMGQLLKTNLSRNIFEIITIPPTKVFTVTYNVTFWAQYTQQINDMMSVMMSAYIEMRKRTFRLETDKGYWFVAYVAAQFTSDSNFDDFTDSERLVKCSFDIEVPAFLIAPNYPGAQNPLRRFVATPELVFETLGVHGQLKSKQIGGPMSGDPGKYVLQDMDDETANFPGAAIAGSTIASADSRNLKDGLSAYDKRTVNVGGAVGGELNVTAVTLLVDPFTNKKLRTPLRAQTITTKGEVVYKNMNDGMEIADLDIFENIRS